MMRFRWIACITLLALLPFPAPGNSGPKAVEAFCPVIARGFLLEEELRNGKLSGYLLGAWSKDGWLQDKVAASLLRGGEKYCFYNLTGEAGLAVGSPPSFLGKEDEPCHDTLEVSFAHPPRVQGGLVAVGTSFNALPRIPKLLSPEQQVYKEAAAAILMGTASWRSSFSAVTTRVTGSRLTGLRGTRLLKFSPPAAGSEKDPEALI